jgi:hypothetical protein
LRFKLSQNAQGVIQEKKQISGNIAGKKKKKKKRRRRRSQIIILVVDP